MASLRLIGLFLNHLLLNFYITVLMLQMILEWIPANEQNPIVRFTHLITVPILNVFHKIMPNYKGIDYVAIVFLILLEGLKQTLMIYLSLGGMPKWGGIVILAFASLLNQFIDIFVYTILIYLLYIWFAPQTISDLKELVTQITQALIRMGQRVGTLKSRNFLAIFFLVLIALRYFGMQPLLDTGYLIAIGAG